MLKTCFPIMHKQTVNKIIKMAYKVNAKYGVMATIMFEFGYRIGDTVDIKINDFFNGSTYTLYILEKKTKIRRYFEYSHIDDCIKKYVENVKNKVCNCYLFPSNRKDEKGNLMHIGVDICKKVFREIFRSIPKLRGAYGTHIFRKTFAYKAYRKGDKKGGKKNIYAAMKALGHTNINSTTKYIPSEILEM